MKINFEDYKILVRYDENEDFKEIQYVEHCTEEMTTGACTETYITHWITFVDENGILRKQSFENEDVRFVLVDKIEAINIASNKILSKELIDSLTNIAMDMRRRGL